MTYAFENDKSKKQLATVATSGAYNDLTGKPTVMQNSDFLIIEFESSMPASRAERKLKLNVTNIIDNPDNWIVLQASCIGLEGGGTAFNSNGNKWMYPQLNYTGASVRGVNESGTPDSSATHLVAGSGNYDWNPNIIPGIYEFYKDSSNNIYMEGYLYWPWDLPVGYLKVRILLLKVASCSKQTIARDSSLINLISKSS